METIITDKDIVLVLSHPFLTTETDPLAVLKATFTADSQVLVGTGNGTYAAESGATLRTSLGLGTTDTPQFTGLNLSTGELTTGSINRATGILTLEIAGSPMVSISNTETYFDENLIIKDNAYVGSYSSYDALQILWDGTLKSKYGIDGGTTELTIGSINRASGSLTLEIGGIPELSISSTLISSPSSIQTSGEFIHSGGSFGMVRNDTTDGSDDGVMALFGGGGSSLTSTRGSYILVHGNEHATRGGDVWVVGGSSGDTYRINSLNYITLDNNSYIGSASKPDAMQIESDGDINLSGSNLTINSDLGDVTSKLIFGRTTEGNAEISWDGTWLGLNKLTYINRSGANGTGTAGVLDLRTDAKTVNDAVLILFTAKDAGDTQRIYGYSGIKISDATTGLWDGDFIWYLALNGAVTEKMRLNAAGQLLINTTSAIGSEKLRVNGVGYFDGALTAASYTDNTPWFEGDAISEIMKIKGKDGEIDHESLPEFLRTKKIVYKNKRFVEEFTNGRDIGNNVSMLNVAVMQLYNEIQLLKLKGAKYV